MLNRLAKGIELVIEHGTSDIAVNGLLPPPESLRRTVKRAQNTKNVTIAVDSFTDQTLHAQLAAVVDDSERYILYYDTGVTPAGGRAIVFMTKENAARLRSCVEIAWDGTFAGRPMFFRDGQVKF